MKQVLVLCTGNSCRSQMAEGYLKVFASGLAEVYSAGIEAHGLNQRAVQVMKEDGVDISDHTSNIIEAYSDKHFDYVITVCDHAWENCPFIPASIKSLHHSFPDPAKARGTDEEVLSAFRSVRNEIKSFCFDFVRQYLKAST